MNKFLAFCLAAGLSCICIILIIVFSIGCMEGELFPDFPDVNLELVIPRIVEGEFTLIVTPSGPHSEYIIEGYVEFQDNVIVLEWWSIEINGVYITNEERRLK